VEAAYRKQRAAELAKTAAEELLAKMQTEKSLTKAAQAASYQLEETGLFSRSYGAFVPRIGSSQELADAAFALSEEAPLGAEVFKQGEGFVLISLKQTEKADPAALDAAEKQKIEERLLAQKKEDAISQKLKTLRDSAQISIDPTLDNQLSRR
jgi:peptidyl-prolyl cis-trans isomerase D